ncbi:MAG: hypothetical protein HZA50_19160 [Planctomycetes bacterium]|nr:hypothetical protein [Planctomycetota bacterium]
MGVAGLELTPKSPIKQENSKTGAAKSAAFQGETAPKPAKDPCPANHALPKDSKQSAADEPAKESGPATSPADGQTGADKAGKPGDEPGRESLVRALAMIDRLPLSDAEKAAAVKRILAEQGQDDGKV